MSTAPAMEDRYGDLAVAPVPPSRVLLLLDQRENRALLAKELADRHQVVASAGDAALDEAFDLLVLDGRSLDRLWERVLRRKIREQPIFLPVLLVTSRPGVKMITRHVWRSVDELIVAPVEKAELRARVEVLLRARSLSLELRRQTEAAEEANRAKGQFLATMSHELRTPLNAIAGYTDLLELGIHGGITPLQREDLTRIKASQRHLLGLINEVLNYAKLETGTVHYDIADVPVGEALASAVALVAPQAHAKRLALEVEPAGDEVRVRADEEKLRQILANLLSNAVKFTPRGGRVRIWCEASGADARLKVSDTGVGVPVDKLETIFEPFVQIRSDLTRTEEGTGLGLAISRSIAEAMRGSLTVESAPGRGSTFTLRLPLAPRTAALGEARDAR